MTTYRVEYRWNGGDTLVKGVLTDDDLRTVQDNPRNVILSCEPYVPVIRYETAAGCTECVTNEYVPHYNCRCRASRAHCTSDYCY